MLRGLGLFYGAAFVTGGVLGFVPGVTVDDMFLGLFIVNPLHSAMHIASGVMFLIGSTFGGGAARLWFRIFGGIYAALAAMGFWVGNGMILNCITNNRNDSWGHAALALSMLVIGFATARAGPGPRVGRSRDARTPRRWPQGCAHPSNSLPNRRD